MTDKHIIQICYLNGQNLINKNTFKLQHIIYENFKELVKYSSLNHSLKEIDRLFNNKDSFLICALLNNNIIGYILGEYKNLNDLYQGDSRRVCYITYIYVIEQFRSRGVASKLLNFLYQYSDHPKLSGYMLTFDTENNKLKKFYESKGYMPDHVFRNFNKHDVYFKFASFAR